VLWLRNHAFLGIASARLGGPSTLFAIDLCPLHGRGKLTSNYSSSNFVLTLPCHKLIMPGSLSEQEREAAELFGRAERRSPVTHPVVRRTYTYTHTFSFFSRTLMRVHSMYRENMP
jgi:hypothetical protein